MTQELQRLERELSNAKVEGAALLKKYFNNPELSSGDVRIYVWEQLFGSTLGPHRGIGGQQMTYFKVTAFVDPFGNAVVSCAGKIRAVPAEEFIPCQYVFE